MADKGGDFHELDADAAEYVLKYDLEESLSAAVDEAIQRRTDNPLAVIVEHLQKVLDSQGAPGAPPALARSASPGPKKGRSGDGPLGNDVHVKARTQENPEYPTRCAVPDPLVRWEDSYPDYAPFEWTHKAVLDNSRELTTGHKWADPGDVSPMTEELSKRITFSAHGGKACTYSEVLAFENGRPKNPVGRTGLSGRGLLGKWGANHAADPIVTRFHPTGGQLQVVAIQRKDTGQWAIPGGMVDPGEAVSVTVKREFSEEAGAITDPEERAQFERDCETLFSNGKQVYRGYVDDPRTTDNAWMETTAFHFHCPPEVGQRLPLKAGDDAGQVMWLDVSMDNPTYRELYGAHRALVDEAIWGAWSRGELPASLVARGLVGS